MILRNKPKLSYNGLTVVLSSPSRFDKHSLLSATGGRFFDACLSPEFNMYQCDIRVKEDISPLIPGTLAIALLGEDAMKVWLKNTTNSLGEIRGSLYYRDGVPCISSYYPQDCVDVKDYESTYNPFNSTSNQESLLTSESEGDEKRRHGKTAWSNYGFWLDKDISKIKHILKNGVPSRTYEPKYVIYPNASKVIKDWTETKGQHFYFDIETDSNLNILCLAYSFGLPEVCIVPFLDYKYSPAYDTLHHILRALSICLRDNVAVAHNGSGFDFFVLAHRYKIAIGKNVYDTMVAQHRIYPSAEKSLGHCTSLWTWEPFHKDEGNTGYNTPSQAEQLWRYCGKDVFTMMLIHEAQINYAKKIPGLIESINQANESIRPYLITSLTGIQYDKLAMDSIVQENDKLLSQYLRLLNILVGEKNLKKIRGTGKSSIINSNKQCCTYFHQMLGYKTVGHGKEKKDGTKNASLNKVNMFKLRQRYDNPVIDIILSARELIKETGTLQFNPWKEPAYEQTTT